jgi:formylglycine-generating enzyme required for sulfatase activity
MKRWTWAVHGTLSLLAAAALAAADPDPIVGAVHFVPAGSFTQGSPVGEACRAGNEGQFTHTLTADLLVMETEVTRAMWASLKAVQSTLPADPTDTAQGSGTSNPVQNVTWFEAALFANLLSAQNGFTPCYYSDAALTAVLEAADDPNAEVFCDWSADGYRLPTEGEWEYFARAGTTGAFSFSESNYGTPTCNNCAAGALPALEAAAWFCANGGNSTHPVGRKAANPWGLRDIHGNVWEWCWDWWGDYPAGNQTDYKGPGPGAVPKVARGGGWGSWPSQVRSAQRGSGGHGDRDPNIGFRLVRSGVPAEHITLVPAAAHAPGAEGTNWRTDLVILNRGTARADFTIALLKRDTDNTTPLTHDSSVDAGKAAGFSDVVLAGFGFTGAGALAVLSESPGLRAASRTYNDHPDGTFGQFVPGYAESELLGTGETALMMPLHQNAGFRTNIGFASISDAKTDLVVTLYDGNGTKLGTVPWTLEPRGYAQVDRIFTRVTAASVENGYAEITSGTAGAAYMAYASVTDNKSGDSICIPAQR